MELLQILTNSSAAIAGSKISGSFGKVLQVKNIEHATEAAYTAQSDQTSAYTLNITPTATSSTILINVSIPLRKSNGVTLDGLKITLYKNGTAHKVLNYWWGYKLEGSGMFGQFAHQVIDNPSTTSQVTYDIRVQTYAGNAFRFNDSGGVGSMTLSEIAG